MYQAHYRLSMLAQLHQLAAHNVLNNHAQLHLTVSNILINVLLVLIYLKTSKPCYILKYSF